jgi:hypothetical protein
MRQNKSILFDVTLVNLQGDSDLIRGKNVCVFFYFLIIERLFYDLDW